MAQTGGEGEQEEDGLSVGLSERVVSLRRNLRISGVISRMETGERL